MYIIFFIKNFGNIYVVTVYLESCIDIRKCSKISKTFLFLFSNKMLFFMAGIHNKLVRIANRENPDQTASSEAI